MTVLKRITKLTEKPKWNVWLKKLEMISKFYDLKQASEVMWELSGKRAPTRRKALQYTTVSMRATGYKCLPVSRSSLQLAAGIPTNFLVQWIDYYILNLAAHAILLFNQVEVPFTDRKLSVIRA